MNSAVNKNRQIYDTPEIVAHYASLDYLTPCERLLFDTYIPNRGAVLDLGVGGGRTTPYLAAKASRYVGVDYAPAMVQACREKFPELEFTVADAADLRIFPESSFDAVIFAFNGIDYVLPAESRRECFKQVHRILKDGAVFIFSSHNAHAVVVRQSWNRERLKEKLRRFTFNSELSFIILAGVIIPLRWVIAFGHSIFSTVKRAIPRVFSRTFWRGEGTLLDPVHGGLLTYYSTADRIITETSSAGLRLERMIGNDYPQPSSRYATDWYYYVFCKSCEK